MRRIAMATALCAAMLGSTAAAQVIVNGKALSPGEIAWLSQLSCGPVYPGAYWLDFSTGYWGYDGSSRAEGHIQDRCRQGRVFRDGHMSEEGRLYSPGELLR